MDGRPELQRFVDAAWSDSITPALIDYIRIPNLSPAFDAQWREHGHMERAVELISEWIGARNVPGLALEVVRLERRTPLLYMEVPGDGPGNVLLYGHLDKQPPMDGWSEGLGPFSPAIRDGRLYGRGGADDGYSAFAAVTAVAALKSLGIACPRCVIVIEACEESGSHDLPHYIEALAGRIGTPDLVVCLDSGCGDYERLWMTTSLRGLASFTLSVSTLTEGVHSGAASGIVPSTFRIARQLLDRLEDARSGEIVVRELHVDIPPERRQQAVDSAAVLGDAVRTLFPFQPGCGSISDDVTELLLNRTWRPQLEIIGAAGLPPLEQAGNVMRPVTSLRLSVRLPPTAEAKTATTAVKATLERDPPYGATVRVKTGQGSSGWNAPPLAPWLDAAARDASRAFFGKDPAAMGEGGTIPFMHMLGERFPQAQFLITGVLGPGSNAHGPNEFLELATARRLTACVASVLAAAARRNA